MPVSPARHHHRQYKTLIILVVAMTGSTILLFWIGRLAPVTPLRGKTQATPAWNRIAVRGEDADGRRGFFHFRVDAEGRLYQSSAWKAGRDDPQSRGTIHIVLTGRSAGGRFTVRQTRSLARLVSDLRKRHRIPEDRVQVRSQHASAQAG